MAIPAVTALSTFLALFPATAIAVFSRTRLTGVGGAVFFALCWTGSEWLRGNILTGFPWNLIGYAWVDYAVPRQTAAAVGSYGLSLLTVLLSVLPAVAAKPATNRDRYGAICLIGVFSATIWIGGSMRLADPLPKETGQTVRVVQGNVPQDRKWNPSFRRENIQRYIDLSKKPGAFDLLLWPESAFPGYLDEAPTILDQIGTILCGFRRSRRCIPN